MRCVPAFRSRLRLRSNDKRLEVVRLVLGRSQEKIVMKRSFVRRLSLIGACTLPMVMATGLFAQKPKVEDPGRTTPPPDSQSNGTRSESPDQQTDTRPRAAVQSGANVGVAQVGQKLDDRTLAALILIGNQKEVALSRLAAGRAKSPEVKQLAEEMTKEHGDFVNRLARFAGADERAEQDPNADEGPSRGRVQERTGAGAESESVQPRSGAKGDWQHYDLSGSPLVTFDREAAEQCLQGAEKFLGQQEGATFDRWFMTLQLVGHMGMRDKLLVAQRHATGEMRALVEQGLQTTDQHIRQAEQVMGHLAHAAGDEQTNKRDAATKR